MKRYLALVLVGALVSAVQPVRVEARGATHPGAGRIAGTALIDSQPAAQASTQLRSLSTGQLVDATAASVQGSFAFQGLAAGTYLVELVGTDGRILATSAPVVLSAASMLATEVHLSAMTPGAAQEPPAPAVPAAAAGRTLLWVVLGAAAAAAVIIAVAVRDDDDDDPSPVL